MRKFLSFYDSAIFRIDITIISSNCIQIANDGRVFLNGSFSECVAALSNILDNLNPPLNIFAACNYLNKVKETVSQQKCAERVREALNKGGLFFTQPNSAKKYHTEGVLSKLGFYRIPETPNPKPGDISVQIYEKYGHICMYVGNDTWVSDFRQKTPRGRAGDAFFYRMARTILFNIKNNNTDDTICCIYKHEMQRTLNLLCSGNPNQIEIRTSIY